MAKKQSPKKQAPQKNPPRNNHVVIGLLLILLGLITLGGIIGTAGVAGFVVAQGADVLLGAGKFIIPIIFITAGVLVMRKRSLNATTREVITGTLGLLALLTLLSLYNDSRGGLIGHLLATPLLGTFDILFTTLILMFITATSFILFFDRTPNLFPFFSM